MHASLETFWSGLRSRYRREHFFPSWLGIICNPFFLARRALFLAIIREAKPFANSILLDVGCGSKPYVELFPGSLYIGIDIANPGHDHAGEDIDLIYDGETFPFQDGVFDNVVCFQVLEHVTDPDAFLREIRRVLQPGGLLMLTAPFIWEEHEQPVDFYRYTSFGLDKLLKRNDFEMVRHLRLVSGGSAILQLANAAIRSVFLSWGRWRRVASFVSIPLFAALNLFGLVAGFLWLGKKNLYLDNFVVVRRN